MLVTKTSINILNSIDENKKISISLPSCPHYLITGGTGSGKTTYSLYLLGKLCLTYKNAKVYILDFKGDDQFSRFNNYKNYFSYVNCIAGLREVYEIFSERLKNTGNFYPLIIFIDELASMISYFSRTTSEKNEIQRIIAEILMMGRSKSVHIITSTQRPDSSLFSNGARDNYTFKLGLGNLSSEGKKMIFSSSDIVFKKCNVGYGYLSLHSNEPIFVGVPVFSNFEKIYTLIKLHLGCEKD